MAKQIISGASAAAHTVAGSDDPVTPRDLFALLDEKARNWLSIIESTLDTHQHAAHIYPEPLEPLPQWAVDRLGDNGRLAESTAEYTKKRTMLREALDLAAGDRSNVRYEIWEPGGNLHTFKRLERRSESLQEAREQLESLRAKHPQALIMQVDVRSNRGAVHRAELAHTLIGQLWHAGTSFSSEGDEIFEIQDETGRTISIDAAELRAHPIFERLSAEAKEAVDASLKATERKGKLRAEAAENDAGSQQ